MQLSSASNVALICLSLSLGDCPGSQLLLQVMTEKLAEITAGSSRESSWLGSADENDKKLCVTTYSFMIALYSSVCGSHVAETTAVSPWELHGLQTFVNDELTLWP